MSKPTGTQSYVSPTLAELMKIFQPDERIDVRRVSFEKKILEQAMANFSAPQKEVVAETEPDITVTDFNEEPEGEDFK